MEIVDLHEPDILAHAESGEIEPLAEHIERGGALGPDLRKWLADHLRGKHTKKPGNKRLWSQVKREMVAEAVVRRLQYNDGKFYVELRKLLEKGTSIDQLDREDFFKRARGSISESKAIDLYLEMNPEMNRETLKTYIKKAKKLRRERGW